MIGVFFVSAYWHGVHAGYYLFAVVAFMMIFAEYCLEKCITSLYKDVGEPIWICFLRHFFHWRGFEFAAVPFMFLKFDLTLAVWKKLCFSGFAYMVVIILLSKFLSTVKRKSINENVSKEKVQ